MAQVSNSGLNRETTATKAVLPTKKPDYKYLADKDREIVRGIFRYHEVPQGVMEFSYKKWPTEQVENYRLLDGEIYSLPLGVAKHLNQDCWYPVHSFIMDENKKPTMKIGQKIRRCSFQSLEFVDVEDLTPVGKPLIEVTNI